MNRMTLAAGLVALAAAAPAADPKPVKVGDLSAPAPADWKAEKPANRLRSYQFKLPAAGDEEPAAEVIVMPESNPDPAKSFPRWREQFVPPDGMTAADLGTVTKLDLAGGATAHVLDLAGTWKFKERPFDPKSKEELRENYRVVWVIVAGKDEATHVRLSGPGAAVEKHKKAFDGWLKALAPAGK